jgi:hypothetical protein
MALPLDVMPSARTAASSHFESRERDRDRERTDASIKNRRTWPPIGEIAMGGRITTAETEKKSVRYSARSATVGSTRVARSAGMNEARSEAASRMTGAINSTSGSTLFTP